MLKIFFPASNKIKHRGLGRRRIVGTGEGEISMKNKAFWVMTLWKQYDDIDFLIKFQILDEKKKRIPWKTCDEKV